MSWLVEWNGNIYDVDPGEFSGRELSNIKLRTALSYKQLVQEIGNLDADAIRALFWTVDVRTQPDLKFGDYDGPPLKVVLAHIGGFVEMADELGKALESLMPETGETSGSQPSPSSMEPSTAASTTG